MSDTTKTQILRHNVADYLKVGSEFVLMSVFNAIDENPTAQVKETQYTADKTKSKRTIGYSTTFPITADMYKNEKTSEFLRDIGEEQRLGADCETEYVRVRLYQPIAGKTNVFYARLFRVAVEISGITGAGGESMVIAGNLNGISDVVIGTFDTTTKTFTALAVTPPTEGEI